MRNRIGTLITKIFLFVSAMIVFFACSVNAQALLQVGGEAEDFTLSDLQGKDVTLSRLADKKAVVIVFWSTWSTKSERALKRFQEFYSKYGRKGIEVLAVNADKQTISAEDRANIVKFVSGLNLTFPVILDRELKTFHSYHIIALPSVIVVEGGKITYELPGFPLVGTEDMFDYLLTVVGEQPLKKAEPKYRPRHDAVADAHLAMGFVKKEKYVMAYPLFRKAIAKDPKYMLPYVELAKLYMSDGKTKESEETLKDALRADPENTAILSELGYLSAETGRAGEAVGMLEKAVKKDDSYTPARYYLAYALAVNGKEAEAMAVFRDALAANPFDSMIYMLRGKVFESEEKPAEASADYRKALELKLGVRN